jgi:hypothetical protein
MNNQFPYKEMKKAVFLVLILFISCNGKIFTDDSEKEYKRCLNVGYSKILRNLASSFHEVLQ